MFRQIVLVYFQPSVARYRIIRRSSSFIKKTYQYLQMLSDSNVNFNSILLLLHSMESIGNNREHILRMNSTIIYFKLSWRNDNLGIALHQMSLQTYIFIIHYFSMKGLF